MKFVKKPIVIEAIQFNGSQKSFDECVDFTSGNFGFEPDGQIYIDTLEEMMRVDTLDWVIKGVEGEFYCCDNRIFQKTYEKVED